MPIITAHKFPPLRNSILCREICLQEYINVMSRMGVNSTGKSGDELFEIMACIHFFESSFLNRSYYVRIPFYTTNCI